MILSIYYMALKQLKGSVYPKIENCGFCAGLHVLLWLTGAVINVDNVYKCNENCIFDLTSIYLLLFYRSSLEAMMASFGVLIEQGNSPRSSPTKRKLSDASDTGKSNLIKF